MIEVRAIDPLARSGSLVSLWNRRLGSTFPLDERLLLQQLRMERGPSLCLGAFEASKGPEGRLVGAALAKIGTRPEPEGKPPEGFISFIIVDESVSRRGVGSGLLERAAAWAADRGARSLNLGSDTYHFFPGLPLDGSPASKALDAFLEARGFEKSRSRVEEDLIADLRTLDLPTLARESPLADGYRFRLYEDGLREAAEGFLMREFPGRWHNDTIEALDAGMRGLDLALLQEESSGEVVGFSRIYDSDSPVLGPGLYWRALMGESPGALGPIGVSASVRGKGLGLALLRLCLEELAGRGVRTTVIDWTDLGEFYAKMGFVPWKAYRYCKKKLRQGGD
jgi:GNAT superfamily N-acetyltransferase